ncbi:nitrate- and nitrite sensing domain-containing protein [Dactylosporangium sp. AC04546]|uniref:sensor histidine kinase n=1 Tax=Dactylosporangium sp. AC04546 TaxID=2862460 RepID=UPI001EDD9B83|nr:nitrate- and nitrite sensing domain-containing protein [Dactylosporangium sp. AC04546]WVK85721.1 nitrate- and nitrite sensing domain-containing protein [Dactylosporangium sp. AC04546]
MPLVAVVVFAGIALISTVQQVNRTRNLQNLAALASEAGGLAHALQRERAAAVNAVLSSSAPQLDAFNQQVMLTDDTARTYAEKRGSVGGSDLLGRIDTSLAALAKVREQVRNKDAKITVSGLAFTYRILVADLLTYRESVARSGAPTDLADEIRAAAALSRAAEALGQQQVAVLRAVNGVLLTPALQVEITATRTSFVEASVAFNQLAPGEWRTWYEQASTGEQVVAAQRFQDQVARTGIGQQINVDPVGWINAMSGWSGLLYQVEQKVDDAVVAAVEDLRGDQMTQAAIQIAAVAAVLLIAIILTGMVARRITRRLRYLHDAARTVAYDQLPAVVSELRAAAPGTVDPDEVADRASATLAVSGADEVADVASAFRAVHREAVRIAGEQAVMRSNVAEIFVHLSRREQRLVDAVLAQVDRVERDETDPDRLQQLYQLDHLATRMARINLSLLVLGGSGAARIRREDAPLGKVLQAAISQIEHYVRVRFGSIDDDVAVVAEAVDEIVHLLAELLDNATGYSPPESDVWVTARALGDRVIIQIVDSGVGLAPARREQLNDLLAEPPAIDIAAVRAMGLTVVGHIAARYNILVQLRPGQHTGTLAEVTIPSTVFRPIMASERQPQLAPVGAPGGGESAQRPANDLFTPQAQQPAAASPENSLFSVPTQELRAVPHAQAMAAPMMAPPSMAPPSMAAPPQAYQTQEFPPQGYQPPAAMPMPAAAPPPPGPGAWPPLPPPDVPAALAAVADESIELPIFKSVNGWFRVESSASAAVAVEMTVATTAAATTVAEPVNWETSADTGWRAAQQAATPQVSSTTSSGLPVRAAGRHLVPGAAEPSAAERAAATGSGAPRRDPTKVAAAMSAYARGVANRRTSAN